jgi:Leucine-rich repeat (LRR) protein
MNKLYIAGIGLIVLLVLTVVLTQQKSDRSDAVVNATSTMASTSPKAGEPAIAPENTMPARVSLDLSGKGLTKTPMTIFAQTDIEELNLSGNALEGSLPAEIWHLTNLRVLNLNHNKFSGVPAEIGQLQNLEVLDRPTTTSLVCIRSSGT